jgi:hypothetical protein
MINKIKKFFYLFLLFDICILFLFSNINAFTFDGSKVNIISSEEKKLHESPDFVVQGEFIHVIWTTWPTEYESYIYYKNSNNSGKTWNPEKLISFTSTKAIYPSITKNNNSIHIAWIDYQDNVSEIYYSRSINNGDSFLKPERLTFNSSRKTYIYELSIHANDKNIYLIWKDYRFRSSEIFFKKSSDNGYTWTDDQRLTADYSPSYFPILGYYKDDIIIFYEDWIGRSTITTLKSNDNGENWKEKKWISDTLEKGDSTNPDIHISEKNIYIVFQNDITGKNQIYFMKSSDFGNSWDEIKQLTFSDEGSIIPRISANSDRLIIFWTEFIDNSNQVFFINSTDEGNNWSESKKLELDHNFHDLSVFEKNENIFLIWQNYHEPGWADICIYKTSFESGTNDITKDQINKNKSPGFQIILTISFILITTIFIKMKIYNGKR